MTVRPEIRQTTPSWGHLNVINTSENMLSGVSHQSVWPIPWLMHQKDQVMHSNPQQHTDRQTLTQMYVHFFAIIASFDQNLLSYLYLDCLLRILNACLWWLKMLYKLAICFYDTVHFWFYKELINQPAHWNSGHFNNLPSQIKNKKEVSWKEEIKSILCYCCWQTLKTFEFSTKTSMTVNII